MGNPGRFGQWLGRVRPLLASLSDPRHIINGAILAMAVTVFGLAGFAAWEAYGDYREARHVVSAVEASDHLIQATGQHALERGLTALLLGQRRPAPSAGTGKTQADDRAFPSAHHLLELRRDADRTWEQGIRSFRSLSASLGHPEELQQALQRAERTHQQLRSKRREVDSFLTEGGTHPGGSQWFSTSTAFIETTADLRKSLSSTVAIPPELGRLHGRLQEHAWVSSEHAGRIRGLMAYYVGAGEPVPEALRTRIQSFRGVVERNLRALASHKPEAAAPVANAITTMKKVYHQDYRPVEQRVLEAATSGDYPLEGRQWITHATATVNAVRGVSAAISTTVQDRAGDLRRKHAQQLALFAGLMLLTGGLAGYSLVGVRRAANNLFRQKELAEVTLHSIGDAVITTDGEGRVEYLNPVAEEMTGWTSEEARGCPVATVFRILNGQTGRTSSDPVTRCLAENRVVGLENDTLLMGPDGSQIAIEDSAAPIRDLSGEVVGAVLVFYRVGEEPPQDHLLGYHATHDTLTRLYNRREFERRLSTLVAQAHRDGGDHALLVMDLDQFKLINDTCGHAAGDNLLRRIAQVLDEHLGPTETLARLGGDEFGILLRYLSLDQARDFAEKVYGILRDMAFSWEGKTFELDASLGLVPITSDSPDGPTLLGEADAARSTAKDPGRHPVQVYSPENLETTRHHTEMQWVPRIHAALEADRFRLDCQPIVPIGDEGPRQGEVLVRMLNEDGEAVPPLNFIPVAERYGLMPDVDRWVIHHSLATIGGYMARTGDRDLRCNINLSGTSLADPDLAGFIERELEAQGVPLAAVCFEITETAAVANFDQARAFITTMRELGCYFALDDFGSGLSSFTYLNNLPVDYLKIDGYLVSRICEDTVTRSMVQAIHQVGRTMGLQTIAEFVDDDCVLGELRSIGVDFAQGFGIAPPQAIEHCLSRCGTRAS